MSEPTDTTDTADTTPSPRKPWIAPTLECIDVAERTNKKTLSPSDGTGTHTVS